jgi:large subunit ribosomal protein L13
MKTFVPKKVNIKRDWYIIDASNIPVGRLATEIAIRLRGKNKVEFTPHLNMGGCVVVINSELTTLTGGKWDNKNYFSYAGYVGNIKKMSALEKHKKNNTFIIENAVAGMIPKTKFKKDILKRLKVFPSSEHTYLAQKPIHFTI